MKKIKFISIPLGVIILVVFAIIVSSRFQYFDDFKSMISLVIRSQNTKASIDDYKFFDNVEIKKSSSPFEWPKHKLYNQIGSSKTLDSVHKKNETVAFLVIKNDSIIKEDYFLGYDENSMTNSFSMSKSIISFLFLKSIEEGTIPSLNSKLTDYFPAFNENNGSNVTLSDLSTMSSGLEWQENYKDLMGITAQAYVTKDLNKLMMGSKFSGISGDKFKYLSGNTQLLAMAIEKANNSTIQELTYRWLWNPMGAKNDAIWMIDSKEKNMTKAYCCLSSNAKDFAKVGLVYKNFGKINEQNLIDSSFISMSIKPRFNSNPIYGYGIWIGKQNNIDFFSLRGHQGQYVIVIPKENAIIVRLGKRKSRGSDLNNHPSDFNLYITESLNILSNIY
ncbi:MAG: serine hydrolase [Flavobacteriaceae bacterium]|nr:serine hydrolase [Flavobacteriaceae bacterium]MBL6680740.1 serine hydrolase [Flavobacteriaceae bacterium]|tara:strand:+ start:1679 stop:2848 length:1170 start_codon:yes stop_codon:yes gene_type:complete